jgi:hypothetical protein
MPFDFMVEDIPPEETGSSWVDHIFMCMKIVHAIFGCNEPKYKQEVIVDGDDVRGVTGFRWVVVESKITQAQNATAQIFKLGASPGMKRKRVLKLAYNVLNVETMDVIVPNVPADIFH